MLLKTKIHYASVVLFCSIFSNVSKFIVHSCSESMLLFPHNSSIFDSMILCLESLYRTVLLVLVWYQLEVAETPHFQCMAECILSVNVL